MSISGVAILNDAVDKAKQVGSEHPGLDGSAMMLLLKSLGVGRGVELPARVPAIEGIQFAQKLNDPNPVLWILRWVAVNDLAELTQFWVDGIGSGERVHGGNEGAVIPAAMTRRCG